MKKSILLILICFACELSWAQQKELKFYYIVHSIETPVAKLCEDLRDFQKAAKNRKEPTIFYLSNMNSPIIACYNVGGNTNDDEHFSAIIGALQGRNYHTIDVQTDVRMITSLLEAANLQDNNGNYSYSHLFWRVYLTQEFWQLKYNEKILAKVLYITELQNASNFVRLQIYYTGEEDFIYDEKYPLGRYNLCPEIKPVFIQL